jgi:DNA polymerase (family 10)
MKRKSASPDNPSTLLSNADIADRLASLAQLLSAQNENPCRIKAYRRAAAIVRTIPESLDERRARMPT